MLAGRSFDARGRRMKAALDWPREPAPKPNVETPPTRATLTCAVYGGLGANSESCDRGA